MRSRQHRNSGPFLPCRECWMLLLRYVTGGAEWLVPSRTQGPPFTRQTSRLKSSEM